MGLCVRVEQTLDMYFNHIRLKKATGGIRKYFKRPLESMCVVSALFPIVHWRRKARPRVAEAVCDWSKLSILGCHWTVEAEHWRL